MITGMRRLAPALLVLVAACGTGSGTAAPPSPSPSPTASPTPVVPYFATPEAAMRYLAAAYNRHDLVALKHVTTPIAREALDNMRSEAIDLRLDHCTRNKDRNDYDCTFRHGFPAGYDPKAKHDDAGLGYAESTTPGTATFVVGPARRSGWYMTVLESCG